MILGNVKIVLSRVSEPGNIGAVCRVMKNMGLSRLRLAAPDTDCIKLRQIKARAVHALDIWENAEVFDTLYESVKDCAIVVGTTRRRGQYRKDISMTPRALANWLAEHPACGIAIVFGNERTGLEDSELDLCNFASHIPASDAQPSLNLSHAVQVYAYELFLAFQGTGDKGQGIGSQSLVKGTWQPMSQEQIVNLVTEITDTLKKFGFYKQYGREEQEHFLRDVIARAGLSEKEGRYFRDLLVKAGRLGDNRDQ